MRNLSLLFLMLISMVGLSQTSLPLDFENGPYTFNDFDGGVTTVITNPQSGGINTSANVAQQVRTGGATWAGGWILLDSYLDFTTNNTFTMKVYSPAIGVPILLKLEGDGGVNTELIVNTTVADEWEVLIYGFTGQPSATYNKLVFIFNMGTTGAGEAYLFDDVEFIDGSGGLSQIDLPVTFEEIDVDYTLTDFGGNASSLVADPEDATNTVAEVIRGNEGWSGTTIGTPAGFATDIPISMEDSKMNVRVWAPAVGIPVMLKIESLPTSTCETVTNTTVSGWQVLEFDFLNERPGTETLEAGINYGWTYNKASIFFDFQVDAGSVTTVGETYYFDDLFFGGTVLSSDATLSDLTVSQGTLTPVFTPSTHNYSVELPAESTVVPTVTPTENDANANAVVTPASSLPGSTTVLVTAEDASELTYTVSFTLAPSSVNEINHNSLTVYPNPAKEIITVSNDVTIKSINIYTIHGQKVNIKMISENTIDISDLAVGVYTITVTDKLGNISTNKIIKI